MINSLIISVSIIVGLSLGWVVVQNLWRKLFIHEIADEDVLASRSSCGDCGCGLICTKKLKTKNKKN